MLEIHKSMHPLTEFAPTWKIPLWFDTYPDIEKLDIMRKWILDNEKKIIEEHKYKSEDDGGTGLGQDSLTAQYKDFNLFKLTQDIQAFQNLFHWLQDSYKNFMHEHKSQPRKCIMFCWANVLRKGQSISIHNHGAKHFSYLSGNLHFEKYNTKTMYHNPVDPYNVYKIENTPGNLTFFPSYIYHQAEEYKEDKTRVSMAFDLFDSNFYKKFYKGDRSNGIEFNA
jgi:hypothetical protein|tara:strand:- start:167 stop:838 length:672 start_codon:yes stop_codon:yes gene_type:complete